MAYLPESSEDFLLGLGIDRCSCIECRGVIKNPRIDAKLIQVCSWIVTFLDNRDMTVTTTRADKYTSACGIGRQKGCKLCEIEPIELVSSSNMRLLCNGQGA